MVLDLPQHLEVPLVYFWLRHGLLSCGPGHISPLQQLTGLLGARRFFFRSGNIEHPEDKLFNTSVEVLPFDVSTVGIGRS